MNKKKYRDWRRGQKRGQGTSKNRRKKKTREKKTRNIRFRSSKFRNGMRNTIRKRKPKRTRRNKGRH